MKRKCTPDQFNRICEMLYQLTDILLAVGVAELKISAKEKEIFWDTAGGGLVDGGRLDKFAALIDKHFFDAADKQARARDPKLEEAGHL